MVKRCTTRAGAGGEVSFPHGDLVGSTMMRVDAAGQAATTVAYTAFGEPISAGVPGVPNVQGDADWAALGSIYRYCGNWNYQTGNLPASVPDFDAYEYPVADDLIGLRTTNPTLPPIILTHVGYRWYDASIGRFVQRDPIGLRGGVNVYGYCGSNSLAQVDPFGLEVYGPTIGGDVVVGPIWIGGDIGIVTDGDEEAIVISGGAGAGIGTGADVNIGGLVSDADDIGDLDGPGVTGGVIAPVPIGGNVFWGPGYKGACVSVGPSIGAAGFAGTTATVVIPLPRPKFEPPHERARYCFVEGTPVRTPDGSLPIECVRVGDLVMCNDPRTGDECVARVLSTHCSRAQSTVVLRYDSGAVLECTPQHPFWVNENEWVSCGDIEPGDALHVSGGEVVNVGSVEIRLWDSGVAVYTLSVDHPNTFYAGAIPVLVHNKTPLW